MQRITCFTAVKIIWFDTLWCEMVYILTLKPTNWSACPVRSWGMETWIYISTKNSLFPSVHLCKLLKQKKPTQFKNKLQVFTITSRKETLTWLQISSSPCHQTRLCHMQGGKHTREEGLKVISALWLDFFFYVSGITTVTTHLNGFYVN